MHYIDVGKQGGGAFVVIGRACWGDREYFVGPTIFGYVDEDIVIVRDRIIGPIFTVTIIKRPFMRLWRSPSILVMNWLLMCTPPI